MTDLSEEVIDEDDKPAIPSKDKSGIVYLSKDKSGILYLSRVPPFMKPNKMRNIMSQFGDVGRIFLQPEDPLSRKRRKMTGGSGKKTFTEGWIEFKKKRIAKAVVQSLNGNILGGKKGSYYHDDIWSMKYLPRFKWINLTEKLAYDQQVRKKRLQTEVSQAKREASFYLEQVNKNKQISAIKRKHESKLLTSNEESSAKAPKFINSNSEETSQKNEIKSVKQRKLASSNKKSIPKSILKNVFTQ